MTEDQHLQDWAALYPDSAVGPVVLAFKQAFHKGAGGSYEADVYAGLKAAFAAMPPIDMVLHCPKCGMQHIDAADDHPELRDLRAKPWDNPPHRSHLCHGCGHIWRPADVPTNGVRAVLTKGKDDSPIHDCRVGHTQTLW